LKLLEIPAKAVSSRAMSNIPTEDLTSVQNHGSQETVVLDETPGYALGTENSPEETLRRMQAFPERAAKLMETIRALREADTR
jgi:hypothetical protein